MPCPRTCPSRSATTGSGRPPATSPRPSSGCSDPRCCSCSASDEAPSSSPGLEEEGGLELELTSPVSRGQVVRERLLALLVSLALLVGVVVLVTVGLWAVIDLEGVAVGGIVSTAVGLLLLTFAFASLAFAAGAATGRRGVALGVGAGVAVLTYIADAIGAIVPDVGWLTAVSPWSWYLGEDPMTTGLDPVGFTSLAVLAAVTAVLAVVIFERRDLCV